MLGPVGWGATVPPDSARDLYHTCHRRRNPGGFSLLKKQSRRDSFPDFTATMLSMSSCLREACNLLKETDYPRK